MEPVAGLLDGNALLQVVFMVISNEIKSIAYLGHKISQPWMRCWEMRCRGDVLFLADIV